MDKNKFTPQVKKLSYNVMSVTATFPPISDIMNIEKGSSASDSTLLINELYYSIQGEGAYAGYPCIFIRTTGCNLRCQWCDSEFSFSGGQKKTFSEIFTFLKQYPQALVEVTGGEPLLHKNSYLLMDALVDQGRKVLLETSGSISIEKVNPQVHIVLDLKAPDSGEQKQNLYENLKHLKSDDDLKIIIASDADFKWAETLAEDYPELKKLSRPPILQIAFGSYDIQVLVEKIKSAKNLYRLGMQLHKYIYPPTARLV